MNREMKRKIRELESRNDELSKWAARKLLQFVTLLPRINQSIELANSEIIRLDELVKTLKPSDRNHIHQTPGNKSACK